MVPIVVPRSDITHKTTATIAGVPILGDMPVSWSSTSGTSPHQGVFRIAASSAPKIQLAMVGGAEASLEIVRDATAPILNFEKLTILAILSGGEPWSRNVLVADRRWRWSKNHVRRSYNMRRRMGNRRLIRHDQLDNLDLIDTVQYAPYSLNAGKPWTATEILNDVMGELMGREDLPWAHRGPAWKPKDTTIPKIRTATPIEDLVINEDGASALGRILQHIPGMTCTVEASGQVVFYDTLDSRQEEAIAGSGPKIFGGGFPVHSYSSTMRPRKINVLMRREIEVRFDRSEGADQIAGGGVTPFLDNVLPIPDTSLVIGGKTLLQGTWITVDQALAAWATLPLPPGAPGPITAQMVRDCWSPGWCGLLSTYGAVEPGMAADLFWPARVGAVLTNYRQTWRIPREWMDRIVEMRANRVALIDPTTGTRAPTQAWMGYSMLPTARSLAVNPSLSPVAINVNGYSTQLNRSLVAPVGVEIIDEELGIVGVDFKSDFGGYTSVFFPSTVANVPTPGPANLSRHPRFWDEAPGAHINGAPKLDDRHGVAMILTCVPASPNDQRQFEKITVEPAQAIALLRDAGADPHILPADGPELDIYVGPEVVTARHAWIDNAAQPKRIAKAFGLDDGDGSLDSADWMNEVDCKRVALAVAAVAWSSSVDRLEGHQSMPMSIQVRPRGTIPSVTHMLDSSGVATSSIMLPAVPEMRRSMFTLLPDHIRARIMRLVQP